ncbi:MAG: sigma-70 family RNA polymerase sigma factor [Pirellulales bacterium]|nr:sigma-70 family RNA polymerase sigma factor [Pirellulales bacterium]
MTTTLEQQNGNPMAVADLVSAAQDGDCLAFGELANRFEGMVYTHALRRLGDHSEAQELTQEVLLKAFEKLHQLKVPAAFGGWLRSITVRMSINRQVRRSPTIATEPQMLAATCVDLQTPVEISLQRERVHEVQNGLRRLGKMDRTTLEAFYVRGQSLAEMSQAFSAPVGTIKRRLHVARKRLAQELETSQAV